MEITVCLHRNKLTFALTPSRNTAVTWRQGFKTVSWVLHIVVMYSIAYQHSDQKLPKVAPPFKWFKTHTKVDLYFLFSTGQSDLSPYTAALKIAAVTQPLLQHISGFQHILVITWSFVPSTTPHVTLSPEVWLCHGPRPSLMQHCHVTLPEFYWENC